MNNLLKLISDCSKNNNLKIKALKIERNYLRDILKKETRLLTSDLLTGNGKLFDFAYFNILDKDLQIFLYSYKVKIV